MNHPQTLIAAFWIKAGEMVFQAPISFEVVTATPERGEKPETLLTMDGRNPYTGYFVREKGKIERLNSCFWEVKLRLSGNCRKSPNI